MNGIYFMSISINFLIQSIRILHIGNYDDEELEMFYTYFVSVDEEILVEYKNTCTILSYENDLELFIEIINKLIEIYEVKEEYEKCDLLKQKKDISLDIIKSKTI
jgi:hypothetical protein